MTFDEFSTNVNTLADNGGLTGKEKSSFLIDALKIFMQAEADKEKTQMLITADAGVKSAQVSLINAQKSAETVRMAVLYQQELGEKIKNGNVSISHTYDAEGNVLTTTYGTGTSKSIYEEQRDLFARQRTGFDDKLRSDTAQHAAGVVGMIYASGATVPTDAFKWVQTKAELVANPNYVAPA